MYAAESDFPLQETLQPTTYVSESVGSGFLLPATLTPSALTADNSTTPSVADAFGFKTDPPAGFDAGDGVHPFSQTGTNDTINMIPVKELSFLTVKRQLNSATGWYEWNSTGNLYNFDTETILDGSLFESGHSSGWYISDDVTFTTAEPMETFDTGEEDFCVASSVAYDPTGSGRDDHVFYFGVSQVDYSTINTSDLLMMDYSYEDGREGTFVKNRLTPGTGNNTAYAWTEHMDKNSPDKYLSVTAGNFNGNGKETVVLYDPQYGNLTLRECTTVDDNDNHILQADLVCDLGNEVTVGDVTLNDFWDNQNPGSIAEYANDVLPLVHMAAGDLDGDEKDELVVAVSPLKRKQGSGSINDNLSTYVDCCSQILVFNKENDGSGNAVWTLKASQTLSVVNKFTKNYEDSMCGAAAVIGDVDQDNQDELLIVGQKLGDSKLSTYVDSQYTQMEYGYSSETESWDLTAGQYYDLEFSTGISPTATTADGAQPVYTVPSVGLVHLDGIQYAPSLFVSGKIYNCSANGGGFSLNLRSDALEYHTVSTPNECMRQPVIGNFDGNIDGREQLLVPICGYAYNVVGGSYKTYKQSILGIGSFYEDGRYRDLYCAWLCYKDPNNAHLGKMVLAAPDADTDDGMVMRYTGKEYVFSNPEVMAVLQASPYFEDLLDDYENIGVTGFGTSSGTGSSFSNTVSNTVGAYVSFSQDFSVFGVKVASVEFQAAYNYEWSKTNEVSHTYETAISYEAGSGSNQVVMIATPVILYHYDVLGLDGKPMATSEVSVSQAPCYTVIPVEDYNASAELLGNPVIDNRCVVGVVPGQPQTYPSSKWQIDSYGGVTVPFDTPVLASQGNAVVSQEVSEEDSQSLTQG